VSLLRGTARALKGVRWLCAEDGVLARGGMKRNTR